jgi:hypothetical protein
MIMTTRAPAPPGLARPCEIFFIAPVGFFRLQSEQGNPRMEVFFRLQLAESHNPPGAREKYARGQR